MLWLPTYTGPAVLTSPLPRLRQYSDDSLGSRIQAISVKKANETVAITATLRFQMMTAKTTKSSGVSLIAAASPIRAPRGIRRGRSGSSGSRSATTSAMSIVLTCP